MTTSRQTLLTLAASVLMAAGLALTPSPASAQTARHAAQAAKKSVTGRVTDSRTGEPVVGAMVADKQTKSGGVTDAEGRFSITVPQSCTTLTVSSVGYSEKRVAIKGTTLNIALDEAEHGLDDVVVVGYGSTARKDLTGSIAVVSGEDIKNVPVMSIDDALTGKASGVQVTKADGSPGGAVRIRIRGGATLQGAADPLYIVDGVPMEIRNNYISGNASELNPLEAANYGAEDFCNSVDGSFARGLNSIAGLNLADVESISILKDASATAIYGSKAANGVVIVTTKKGRHDMKPQFSLNYYLSATTPVKEKVLNAQQYKDALTFSLENSNKCLEANRPDIGSDADRYIRSNNKRLALLQTFNDGTDTDWLDLVLRTGMTHNVDFNVTGGGNRSRYYTSFNYTTQDGTLIGTDFNRYAAKVNLDNDITTRFRTGVNLSLSYTKNNVTNGLYGQALSAPPVLAPYNADGSFASYEKVGGVGSEYMGFQNPLAVATSTNRAKTYGLVGSIYGEVDVLKDLKFKSMVSLNWQNYHQWNYIPSYVMMGGFYGGQDSEGGQGSQAESTFSDFFWENTLTYSHEFSEAHRLTAVVGTSWEKEQSDYFAAGGMGYPDDTILNNLSSAAKPTYVSGATPESQSSLLSFYARLNYVLLDRYLLTFTGRSDASSKFAKGNRVGYFPSGAIAWRMTKEKWLRDVKWLDELKLRASIGKTGTQRISDHMFRTLYAPGSYNGQSAIYPSQLGNDHIRWESTVQKDLGLDFMMLGGRLGGTLAYYYKTTSGALLSIPIAPSTGFDTVVENIAKVRNDGVEFDLWGDIIRTKDWKWTASFNISHNASKVLHLEGSGVFTDASNRKALNMGTSVLMEGEPLGQMWGRLTNGIIKTQADLDAYKQEFQSWSWMNNDLGIGAFKYVIEDDWMKEGVIGNSTPDFHGGLSSTLQYKNWALMASFTFSCGADLMYQKDVSDLCFSSMANRGVRVLEGCVPADQITDRPLSSYQTTVMLTDMSVYDASYLKLQTLSLSYNLPKRWLTRLHLNQFSLYATASNLFTITSYPGPDPAVSDDPYSIAGGGRDVSTYPTVRSYTFGVRLGF